MGRGEHGLCLVLPPSLRGEHFLSSVSFGIFVLHFFGLHAFINTSVSVIWSKPVHVGSLVVYSAVHHSSCGVFLSHVNILDFNFHFFVFVVVVWLLICLAACCYWGLNVGPGACWPFYH